MISFCSLLWIPVGEPLAQPPTPNYISISVKSRLTFPCDLCINLYSKRPALMAVSQAG